MERREFIGACASLAASAAACPSFAAADAAPRFYARTLLLDAHGAPLRASSLLPERNYVFHYPFAATPCFLLDLGRPTGTDVMLRTADGRPYAWRGGVGRRASIVAYSAICAHQLAYPTREISFISYRDGASATPKARSGRIHCCAEHSEYDPAQGGRVLGGPAPQPLAAILLDYDESGDRLHAIGTLGGELFAEFFRKYEFKLAMEHGSTAARNASGERTTVTELANYCRQQMRC